MQTSTGDEDEETRHTETVDTSESTTDHGFCWDSIESQKLVNVN